MGGAPPLRNKAIDCRADYELELARLSPKVYKTAPGSPEAHPLARSPRVKSRLAKWGPPCLDMRYIYPQHRWS
jgi:hypothetical protein